MIRAPEVITTDSLVLRRPALADAAEVYAYAHDPEVTRYLVWPTHTAMRESIAFIEACGPRWESGEEYCWVSTIAPLTGSRQVDELTPRNSSSGLQ